jgi:hypothetical protein
MNPLSIPFVLCLIVAPANACPNLAGHYMLRGQDGVVDYTVRQKACDRVEIDRTATYLGKKSALETQVFIPDGKPHGKRGTISRWVGDKLQIGQAADHVYFGTDSAGDLHMSDGRSYPQCSHGPCDEVAKKEN